MCLTELVVSLLSAASNSAGCTCVNYTRFQHKTETKIMSHEVKANKILPCNMVILRHYIPYCSGRRWRYMKHLPQRISGIGRRVCWPRGAGGGGSFGEFFHHQCWDCRFHWGHRIHQCIQSPAFPPYITQQDTIVRNEKSREHHMHSLLEHSACAQNAWRCLLSSGKNGSVLLNICVTYGIRAVMFNNQNFTTR